MLLAIAFMQMACLAAPLSLVAQNEAAPAEEKAAAPAESPADPPTTDPPAAAETPETTESPAATLDSGLDPLFKIEKELIDEATVKEFRKKENDFRIALQAGELSNTARQLITEGIRVRVYSLTLKSNLTDKESSKKIVEGFRRELLDAGTLNPAGSRAFREFVLQELVNRCKEPDILNNHFFVRLQALILLSNTNLVEPNPSSPGVPGQAFTPALDPLLAFIDDPAQPYVLKIVATVGLMNINLRGSNQPTPNQRISMGRSLIRELAQPNTHEWYQVRLLETLASIDQILDLEGKPFIVNAVDATLKDPNRKWVVRCAAAKALGRVQLTAEMRVDLYVIDVLNLAREAAEALNKESQKSPYWSACFWDIYYAFQPVDSSELSRNPGLRKKVTLPRMDKFQKLVDEGYKQYIPLFNHVIAATPPQNIPEDMLNPFREWLQANTPADYQPHGDQANGTKQVQRTGSP
ncbi:MAG: hypothetical protein AB7O26_01450 [Planctomycetaceae bacterium]